jgi:hypothetical protein
LEVLLKLLTGLVCTAALCGYLSACDSTAPKTVTKIEYDTIYTDRFARKYPVVYGEWMVKTATDSADAVFLQDTSSVVAYLFWKKGGTWTLKGTLSSDTGVKLYSNSRDTAFSGKFTDSTGHKKTKMTGMVIDIPSISSTSWTARRLD